MLAVSIQIMSQFSGINVAVFYATSIFQNEIGLSPFISRVLAGCLGTTSFVAAMGSVVLIKYFGREQVLLFNLSGMCSSMIALAVAGKIKGDSAGVASDSLDIPAEITPLATRVQANALSTATNWVCVFTVVMISPTAFNNIGWRTYLIFVCCSAFAMVVVYFCFPETKDRSLEEIELIFGNSSSPMGSVKEAKLTQRHFNKRSEPIKSLFADFQHIEGA